MIYFDNAATGGFKPSKVIDASVNAIKFLCANPGRSSHRLSIAGATTVYNTRKVVGNMFGATDFSRVIFTKNCTEALNTAIFGVLNKGDHVITTVYEHNSVLRPLYYLANKKIISLSIVRPDEHGNFTNNIERSLRKNTSLVCLTAVSNVTGATTDFINVGKMLYNKKPLLLIDGAQGGGHVNINLKKHYIDILCLASHKGLYGIMGSGVLIFNEKLNIRPLIFGGTGAETFNQNQPDVYPEKLESGTINLPAIYALYEGVLYTATHLDTYQTTLFNLTKQLVNSLRKIKDIHLYSLPNVSGIVSFNVKGDSQEFANLLNKNFDIAVRGGFHCAPLMHNYLKTTKTGLVRASLSVQNTVKEVNEFCFAVNKLIT